MGLTTQKILRIDITTSSEEEILEEVRKCFFLTENKEQKTKNKEIKPLLIFTPNPEIISYAQKDDNFKKIVNTAQINLPDGNGVVWALRKLYKIEVARISGADFMGKLVNLAEEESLRIGLIGGRGDLADKTLECLQKKHPRLSGWAIDGPEVEIKNYPASAGSTMLYLLDSCKQHRDKLQIPNDQIKEITDKIIKEKTDILYVAMGFPKQEYFIDSIRQQLSINNYQSTIVLMAVGGSFDYISGRVPRAPKWIRDGGFEWLYRLIREPWRLPRQLKGTKFFWKVLIS